jgi:DNA-binding NtrC family response regulator
MVMEGDVSVPAVNMILVVDDEPSMLRSVENLLNGHGFEVQVFSPAEDSRRERTCPMLPALSSIFISQGSPGLSYISSCPDPGTRFP